MKVGQRIIIVYVPKTFNEKNKYRHATVSKVGRKYFEAKIPGFSQPEVFYIKSMCPKPNKFGWADQYKYAVADIKSFNEGVERNSLIFMLRSYFTNHECDKPLETVRKVCEILGLKWNERYETPILQITEEDVK